MIGPIIFGDNWQVVNVSLYKLKHLEHFVHILLKNIQEVANPHCELFVPAIYPHDNNFT